MKNRGTYVLLFFFFAGLIGLWMADFAQIPTRGEIEGMRSRVLSELLETKPDDLLKVEILGGNVPIVFERVRSERGPKNSWQMTSPMNVAADPSKVETLAYNLKELVRKPDADKLENDPGLYGLEPPSRVIQLWGRSTDAPLVSLELGKISLDRLFVRKVGSPAVEVVDARSLDIVRLAPIDWRDREIFRIPSMEVDSVNLIAGDRSLKLRRGRESWRVAAPIQTLALEPKVEGLIADLGSLRVFDDTRFVANDVNDSDLDRYGLKTPGLSIEIGANRNRTLEEFQILHIGKTIEGKSDQVYARRGDQDDVIALDTRVINSLKIDPNLYRSPKIADINMARVIRIEVEDKNGGFEVVRSGNEWTIVKPTPARADAPAIQSFLKSLDQLQTSSFPSASSVPDPGFEETSRILKIWQVPDSRHFAGRTTADSKGELALSLRIGRRDAARKSLYAELEGDPTLLALPDSAYEFLPRNSLAFRDRQILSGLPEPIQKIKLTSETRNFTLHAPVLKFDPIGNAPLGWWMVQPIETPADSTAIGRLLKLLGNLRAETLVSDKSEDLQAYGLKTPVLTMTWSTLPHFSLMRPKPDSEKNSSTIKLEDRSLLIGAALPGRPNVRYAKLNDRPMIFSVGPDILGSLDAEWHDHHVLTFDAKQIRSIRLDWVDREVMATSRSNGNGRSWSLDPSIDAPDFDTGQLETIVRAASTLTTTRFAQYLGEFPEDRGLTPPRLTVRFDQADRSSPRYLKLGRSAGRGLIFATTEESAQGSIFLLPDALFAAWLKPPRRHDDLPDNVFAP